MRSSGTAALSVPSPWISYAHGGDPLATFASRASPHPALLVGSAWLVLAVGSDLLLTIPRGTFLSSPPSFLGWLDLATVLQEVVVFPLLAFFYIWAPRALLRAAYALRDEQITEIRAADEDWLRDALRAQRPAWLARVLPGWWPLGYVLVAAGITTVVIFWTYTSALAGKLWFADPTVASIKAPFWFVESYMAIWSIVRMTVLVTFLSRLFQPGRAVHLEPLHPDGAGGLAPLAGYSIRITAFIGFMAATFALVEREYFFHNGLQLTWQALPIHVMAVVALLASGVVFFAPLIAPHQAMARTKRARLGELSRQFRAIEQAIDPDDLETVTRAAPRLQVIRSVYSEVERFPVWPFDTRILRFFVFSALGQPALAVAIDIFQEDLRRFARVILGA